MDVAEFRELIWQSSRTQYRAMPWRDEPTFYYVLVSEIMLQQTQVPRVLIKFAEFIEVFPTVETLAAAALADVLRVWSGLGYNRRAKFLLEAARYVVASGQPKSVKELTRLPGVGVNTAAAIMNYVYGIATPFIETNIRTVYIHHFFADRVDVSDTEILELVERTIDTEHPRQWFWALMDCGTFLKARHGARLQQNKHYRRQAPLKGSIREVRGQIVKELTRQPLSESSLRVATNADDRFTKALSGLLSDRLVENKNGSYRLVS